MVTLLVGISNFVTLPLICSLFFRKILKLKYPRLRGWICGLLLASVIFFVVSEIPFISTKIFELIEPEETIYSPAYKESNFRQIQLGMSKEEVLSILGKPLYNKALSQVEELWRYTKQGPSDTNYRIRNVIFVNDKVDRKVSSFYLD